jgi:hypothetical protein
VQFPKCLSAKRVGGFYLCLREFAQPVDCQKAGLRDFSAGLRRLV